MEPLTSRCIDLPEQAFDRRLLYLILLTTGTATNAVPSNIDLLRQMEMALAGQQPTNGPLNLFDCKQLLASSATHAALRTVASW